MLGGVQSIAGIVFIFGIVVFVHELGHFLAAKATGVYAPRFSIGFGPALWRRRRGETEYVIAALPLGGYVRMASREDEPAALLEGGSEEARARAAAAGERPADWDPEALVPHGPRPVPPDRWFESKPLAQRLFIMFAGVTMNALLALLLMIGIAAAYGERVFQTRTVGAVRNVAAAAPLRGVLTPGDTIFAVAGEPVRNWGDVERRLVDARGDSVRIRTQRGEVTVAAGSPGSEERERLAAAIDPYVPPVIDSVVPGWPAARAGIRPGDSVVAVGGSSVRTFSEVVDRIAASPGALLTLDVTRGGEARRISVRPESTEAVDPATGASRVVGRIGAAPRDVSVRQRYSLGTSVVVGARATAAMAGSVGTVLRGLVTGQVSPKSLGGPITIARASATAARSGLEATLLLLAYISINLAVFNLLPIPILDGGQIVLNLAEAAKGSPFSTRTREVILRAGLAAIALLFVVVMWNDITREVRALLG